MATMTGEGVFQARNLERAIATGLGALGLGSALAACGEPQHNYDTAPRSIEAYHQRGGEPGAKDVILINTDRNDLAALVVGRTDKGEVVVKIFNNTDCSWKPPTSPSAVETAEIDSANPELVKEFEQFGGKTEWNYVKGVPEPAQKPDFMIIGGDPNVNGSIGGSACN